MTVKQVKTTFLYTVSLFVQFQIEVVGQDGTKSSHWNFQIYLNS